MEAPETNPQLAHNAGAAASAFGASEAQVVYAKLSEDAVYLPIWAELDALAIDAIRDEFATMIDNVATSEPVPGPHCVWCPMKAACPMTTVHVAEVVDAAKLVRRHPVSLEIHDNDHAASMLTAIDGVEAFVSELKRRLKAYADANGGIELQDGTVYARSDVTTERPDLSSDMAISVLTGEGLTKALKVSTTWAAIKQIGGKDVEKRVREALKMIGAVKSSTSPRYEAKAKKAGKAA